MTSLSEESSSESRTRFEAGFLAAGLRAAGFLYFLHDFVWLKARAGLPRKTLVEGAGRERRVQPAPRALRQCSWMGLCSFTS